MITKYTIELGGKSWIGCEWGLVERLWGVIWPIIGDTFLVGKDEVLGNAGFASESCNTCDDGIRDRQFMECLTLDDLDRYEAVEVICAL